MRELYKRKIFKLLRHEDYAPTKWSAIANLLGVEEENLDEFRKAFEELREAGHVILGSKDTVSLPPIPKRVVGTFRSNPKGFGFVTPLDPTAHGDLFIPARNTGDAMEGDVVAAKIVERGKREGVEMRVGGKIVEILERANNRFVGVLRRKGDGWLVQPEGRAAIGAIRIGDVEAKGAKENDKVVVEIVEYPTENTRAGGVITEVLGRAGLYDTEIAAAIIQFHLPGEFPEGCLDEARGIAKSFAVSKEEGREDVTGKIIITIDPETAKDFDDAISLEKDSHGKWELGVHIADVSTFVADGSELDREAKVRGNSAYLPAKTIPMLPEILSNGICSLQPGQRRFTKSIYITYDEDGEILGRRYANSVICSFERLDYRQADKVLKGEVKLVKPETAALLRDMEKLSRRIEVRRRKAGMIHLDLPETELIMDEQGRVVDAEPADDSYPHTMIEMFMVEANEAAATALDVVEAPFMRRIHPDPDGLTLKKLSRMASIFGFKMPRSPDRKDIQALLESVKGKDFPLPINMFVLRSLERAEYSPASIGHYALASKRYCHFTSPIRRYADLLVHRLLNVYILNGGKIRKDEIVHSAVELNEIGKHLGHTEQQADDAERDLKTVLLLQMLSTRIGDTLDCVITGVASFGIFAQCQKFGIEGLIRLEDLGNDEWKHIAKQQCIEGVRSGVNLHLGKSLKVRIVSIDIPSRRLELGPAEPLVSGKQKESGKDGKGKYDKTAKKNKSQKGRRRGR